MKSFLGCIVPLLMVKLLTEKSRPNLQRMANLDKILGAPIVVKPHFFATGLTVFNLIMTRYI